MLRTCCGTCKKVHVGTVQVLSTLDTCELDAAEEFEKSVQNSTIPGATDGSGVDMPHAQAPNLTAAITLHSTAPSVLSR